MPRIDNDHPSNETPDNSARGRKRPKWLRALGNDDPPLTVTVDGAEYRRVDLFKHDSWAATALYEATEKRFGTPQKIICKFNRRQSFFGLPGEWVGRLLGRREADFLRLFADIPNMPKACGPVEVDGRIAPTAVARKFISGHPLGSKEHVGDEFFAELAAALKAVHERDVAYVDLHKRENVLVGDDGRPYLIDFQVSFRRPKSRLAAFVTGPLLRSLQRMDDYHRLKLQRKCRPDQCRLDGDALREQMPRLLRVHRFFAQPLRNLRRRFLVLLGVRTGEGSASSEQFTEVALREPQNKAA